MSNVCSCVLKAARLVAHLLNLLELSNGWVDFAVRVCCSVPGDALADHCEFCRGKPGSRSSVALVDR